MDGKLERIVQLWKTDQKNYSPIPGVHLKVEQDLQIVEDSIFDIVRFVNDNDGSFSFIQGKPVDLTLNDMKVFSLSVGRLCAQGCGEIPVEIIHCNGRKAGIDHLIQGRVQSGRPGTDQSCFPTARSIGKKTEAFCSGKVIQTNSIESLNATYRMPNRQRSVFPSDTALLKALYLATFEETKKWTTTIRDWGKVYGELSIMYEGRLPE